MRLVANEGPDSTPLLYAPRAKRLQLQMLVYRSKEVLCLPVLLAMCPSQIKDKNVSGELIVRSARQGIGRGEQ